MITQQQLEELEYLPNRIGLKKDAINKEDYWKYGQQRIRGESVWKIANRVLENNIGKSFDSAFSYFCKRVNHNQYWYHCFLENFEPNFYHCYYYYIDEKNLIQYNEYHYKSLPKTHTITSPDYKTKRVYVSDGLEADKLEYNWKERQRREKAGDKIINKIVSGTFVVYTFNDPRAVRDRAEKHTALRHKWTAENKAKKMKQYSFLTKAEKEIERLKANDLIVRDSHGFDKDSFIGIEYHGQKRKLK